MRIVIDLQGAQSPSSRQRGIGRYSMALTKAIARELNDDELFIVLNGYFCDSVCQIREDLEGLVDQKNIRIWDPIASTSFVDGRGSWDLKMSGAIRERLIKSLDPDVILITSLFEGFADQCITDASNLRSRNTIVVIIAYDLIPWIHRDKYLTNQLTKNWYEERLTHFKDADLLLAISDATRRECIQYLDITPQSIVNISSAIDEYFKPVDISPKVEEDVRKKHGLSKAFVMYTGGIDFRKNIEPLIHSYSSLPADLRKNHQLAIVCSIQPHERSRLEEYVSCQGLIPNIDVIFTGFVSESDLRTLYCICTGFIFPSWHEGFGLPVLEAMSCGSAVICSNISSMPEIVDQADAFFDPYQVESISSKLLQLLTDAAFRKALEDHNLSRSRLFSWTNTGNSAIAAIRERLANSSSRSCLRDNTFTSSQKPLLAFISPLPPKKSGIADYSEVLLPYLAEFYNIELIEESPGEAKLTNDSGYPRRSIEWLYENWHSYDRLLYHFGNSEYHAWMIELLYNLPGVVVMHDFFLSGLMNWADARQIAKGIWNRSVYSSHGYSALLDCRQNRDKTSAIMHYPCNIDILNYSIGVITHSEYSRELALKWYGKSPKEFWHVIPLARSCNAISKNSKALFRSVLGLSKDEFLVGTFGMLGSTKLNRELVSAWACTPMANNPKCKLLLVGEGARSDYGEILQRDIDNLGCGQRIILTDRVDADAYQAYLGSVDLAIQLRTSSRGETSAAVLDCMSHGIPTIVNKNGSMAEIPAEAVYHIPDDFKPDDLINALRFLYNDKNQCAQLGHNAKAHIDKFHDPQRCASLYAQAIEDFYSPSKCSIINMLQDIIRIGISDVPKVKLLQASTSLDRLITPIARQPILYVHITHLMENQSKYGHFATIIKAITYLASAKSSPFRIEPIWLDSKHNQYCYAHELCAEQLQLSKAMSFKQTVDFRLDDCFLDINQSRDDPGSADATMRIRSIGVSFYFLDVESLIPSKTLSTANFKEVSERLWLQIQDIYSSRL